MPFITPVSEIRWWVKNWKKIILLISIVAIAARLVVQKSQHLVCFFSCWLGSMVLWVQSCQEVLELHSWSCSCSGQMGHHSCTSYGCLVLTASLNLKFTTNVTKQIKYVVLQKGGCSKVYMNRPIGVTAPEKSRVASYEFWCTCIWQLLSHFIIILYIIGKI